MMIAATLLTSRQARVARQERARAEQQAQEAQFQRGRAEHQTVEAEFHRKRAEREANFATKQLTIARQRTREAELERERASRNARAAEEISSALLELNTHVAQNPAGLDAGKRVASAALQSLSILQSPGDDDSELKKRREELQGIVRTYDQSTAGLNSRSRREWEFETAMRTGSRPEQTNRMRPPALVPTSGASGGAPWMGNAVPACRRGAIRRTACEIVCTSTDEISRGAE